MPYPNGMRAYRSNASSAGPGLSNGPSAALDMSLDSVAKMILQDLGKVPANDAAKQALKLARLGFRIHPLLRLFLTLWDLADAWRDIGGNSAFGNYGYSLACGRIGGTASSIGTKTSSCGSTTFQSLLPINPPDPPLGDNISYWEPLPPPSTSAQMVGNAIRASSNTHRMHPYGWLYPRPETLPAWHYNNPWELPISNPAPWIAPPPYPLIPYRVDPGVDPSPVPHPRPRPQPKPDPWSPPRPKPPPRPEPPVKPKPDPDPKPKPDPDPVHPPPPRPRPPGDPLTWAPPVFNRGRTVKLEPLVTVRQNDAPRHKPPGKGTTEAKLNSRLGSFAWYLAHAVTESKDLLEALWKALPKHLKSKQKKAKGIGKFADRRTPPIPKMFQEVTSGIRKVNQYDKDHPWANETDAYWNRAIDEFMANQIEDFVFGSLGRAVARQSRKSGRPIGYAAGPAL